MVYGRYNELVTGDYFMVYKATYSWGASSCTHLSVVFEMSIFYYRYYSLSNHSRTILTNINMNMDMHVNMHITLYIDVNVCS